MFCLYYNLYLYGLYHALYNIIYTSMHWCYLKAVYNNIQYVMCYVTFKGCSCGGGSQKWRIDVWDLPAYIYNISEEWRTRVSSSLLPCGPAPLVHHHRSTAFGSPRKLHRVTWSRLWWHPSHTYQPHLGTYIIQQMIFIFVPCLDGKL